MQNRCDSLYKTQTETSKKLQESESKFIVVEQSAKNLESKFDFTKKELKTVKQLYEETVQQIGGLKANLEYFKKEKERLEEELKLATNKLSLATREKGSSDSLNAEQAIEIESLKNLLNTQDATLTVDRLELEKQRSKITEQDRENKLLENKKKAADKEFEIVKKNLSDKIQALEERIKTEISAKDLWINRQSEEAKEHSSTKSQLLQATSKLEDTKLKLGYLENEVGSKEKAMKDLIEERNRLNSEIAKSEVEKDNILLEKEKADQLAKRLEEYYKEKLGKRRVKFMKKVESCKEQQERFQCAYEDLYCQAVDLSDIINTKKDDMSKVQNECLLKDQKIQELEKTIIWMQNQIGLQEEDLIIRQTDSITFGSQLKLREKELENLIKQKEVGEIMIKEQNDELLIKRQLLVDYERIKAKLSVSNIFFYSIHRLWNLSFKSLAKQQKK